jgi:hypothetical protein
VDVEENRIKNVEFIKTQETSEPDKGPHESSGDKMQDKA